MECAPKLCEPRASVERLDAPPRESAERADVPLRVPARPAGRGGALWTRGALSRNVGTAS